MSRILKSWNAKVDENNVVTVDNTLVVEKEAEEVHEENQEEIEQIDLEEIRRTAKQIIENAEAEANSKKESIARIANNEMDRIIREAIDKGNKEYESIVRQAQDEGYNQGINSAKDEADQIIKEAKKIREDAIIYKEELIAQIEPDTIELVISILDKLVGIEKEINPQAISMLITQGLSKSSLGGEIKVHVSKEDYPYIVEADILSSLESMAKIAFVEDPTLQNLDCIIETNLGSINCGLGIQYKELRRNLQYILKNR